MVLTQTGESVNGRVAFGTLNSEPVTLPMGGDGSLVFLARVAGDPQIDVNMNLASPGANQITGTVLQTWRFLTSTGQMQIAGNISGALQKSSSGVVTTMAVPASPDGLDRRLQAILGR